jgi:hypothetical protein
MSSLTSATLQCPFKTPCKPCKSGLNLGWTGLQVRGVGCLIFKFVDLFDTTLQVDVPTVYLTL